ncbi:MAG: AMP-binding protein [Gammaproteobacteria bacterium]|nr:AMP-binding protein [Gammaproteobacteria bacterium]
MSVSFSDPSLHCLGDVFSRLAASQPSAAALLDVHGAVTDYATLAARLSDLGTALREVGIQANTRVAVIAPQGPELAMAVLGAMAWASCAPLNPALTNAELAEHCRDLAVRALVVTAGTEARTHTLARELDLPVIACPVVGSVSSTPALAERAPDDIALVLHTSGTTARPKQVPLSHANLLASMQHITDTVALTTLDRGLAVMPLFHIHGLLASLLAPLGAGGSVICTPGLAVPACFTWLKALGPTFYSAVPTMHRWDEPRAPRSVFSMRQARR